MKLNNRLTRNQTLVRKALADSTKPLTAYAILDRLRGSGVRAPVQVYRALERLVAMGEVHRLETLNAYVACAHDHHAPGAAPVFAICRDCGEVVELDDPALRDRIETMASDQSFQLDMPTLELRGVCADCSDDAAEPATKI